MKPERFAELQKQVHEAMHLWFSIGRLQGVSIWSLSAYIAELETVAIEVDKQAEDALKRLARVKAVTSAPPPEFLDAYNRQIWVGAMWKVNEAMEEK